RRGGPTGAEARVRPLPLRRTVVLGQPPGCNDRARVQRAPHVPARGDEAPRGHAPCSTGPCRMYAEFHGFRELPFNITPDPRFLYLNDNYQEALAALGYGIDARKGFIALVGEAGTGKTTLLRRLLDSVSPNTKTVLLLNPTVSFEDILEHILLELGVPSDGGRK